MGKATGWALAGVLAIGGAGAAARGGTIRGDVVAGDGTPGAGAQVWVVRLTTRELDRRDATADAAGRFAVEVGPGNWMIEATRGDEGLGRAEYREVGADPVPPVAIRLGPAGRLRGRLVEAETGRPIAGGRFVIDNGATPVSDADGRFEVRGLGRARYHEAFPVAAGRERRRTLFELAEGPVTDLEIPLARAGKAVGRVLDADGRPIAGAFVGKSTSGSIASLTGLWLRTDDRGRFEYDGLPFGRANWLNAEAEGAEPAQRHDLRPPLDGTPLVVDFRLARSLAARRLQAEPPEVATRAMAPRAGGRRAVAGAVTGPDGRPVADAKVRWGLNPSSDPDIETKTDAAGKFRLTLLPPAAEFVCVIPARPDLAPATVGVAAAGDREVEIKLAPGLTLAGVVRDDAGTPLGDVRVVPTVLGAGPRGYYLTERIVRTDPRGRFEVAGLPDAPLTFSFLGDGLSELRDHPLAPGKEAAVTLSAAGGIRGRVVDGAGRPVRDFRVLLNASRDRQPGDKGGSYFAGFCAPGLSFSADDGRFLIRNLGAGTVQRVTILSPGHGEASIDRVVAGPIRRGDPDQAPAFEVGPANQFQVRVVEEGTRRPIPGASVVLTHGDGTFQPSSWDDSVHAATDAEGVAPFTPLAYAAAMILVQAPGFGQHHLAWDDHSAEVVVALRPAATLAGEVLDEATGRPLDDLIVSLTSAGVGQLAATVGGGDAGRFEFAELPAGAYTLAIATGDRAPLHQEQVTLVAGRREARTIRLSPGKPAAPGAPEVPAPSPVRPGDAAPDFTAAGLDGAPVALRDFRGKYVLLDFWATWCGPCVAEIPNLRAVHEACGADPRFAMLGLSLDAQAATVARFLKDHAEPWRQATLGDWADDPVTKQYGVDSIPSIWLIGPDGKVVAQGLRGEAIGAAVRRALGRD